ncbi:tigger transposable element-derived protein 6-like [Ruditapes philippinarum]|uniref:tigger transposable element-derived protein 6-like n=1 Tax=Ruditapes philippinarum TaxID=129788 RepID=UPI00295BDA0F|nr:tigger transposable element-derived protein 6-like [Ruditapes philippinarum]
MTGDFEKPLVIGKNEKPRCFKHVNIHDLPVTWKWNRKAWMTGEIFKDWIKSFHNKMKSQKRNVFLFLHNATSHPENLNLNNVKIKFLQKNTTSVLQPLDHGILQNMKYDKQDHQGKTHYRKRLIRSVLARIDDGENVSADEISKSVNALQAVRFRKAGFIEGGRPYERASREKIYVQEDMTVQGFLNIDIELPVHEELESDLEDNLIKNMQEKQQNEQIDTSAESEEEKESESVMTYKEALVCIDQLRLFSF